MGNTFAWPIIRLMQRLSMVLTIGCIVYVIFFLFSKNKDTQLLEKSNVVPTKSIGLVSNLPVFDLRPFDANAQTRDVFSMTTTENTTNAVENTPKGQLPDHLKIVGILIAHPSQIVIEDSLTKITYFIDEARPQDGIKIKRVGKDQMIINYQGQDIPVPISKN